MAMTNLNLIEIELQQAAETERAERAPEYGWIGIGFCEVPAIRSASGAEPREPVTMPPADPPASSPAQPSPTRQPSPPPTPTNPTDPPIPTQPPDTPQPR